MAIEADPVQIIAENGRRPTSGPPDAEPPALTPAASLAATQLSFAAASNQFSALARFPFAPVDALSVEDEALADARLRWDHAQLFARDGVIAIGSHGAYADAQAYVQAVGTIEAKAKSLGYDVQSLAVDVTAVPGGYVGAYPGNDIYAQPGGDAFEVHGDIRAKYNALGGPAGLLGLPVTDELGAPDGVGRFNHFQAGSIYWTPNTGPMAVHGSVRDRWAASGWERGPLGYPVQDQHRMVLNAPVHASSRQRSNLPVEWCRFQNGLIAGDRRGGVPVPVALQTPAESLGLDAAPALLTYAELGALFGARLNEQFKASPDNVALRPGVDLTGVSDWKYGFWASTSRSVGFRLRGFHDNGLAPDTDFAVDVRLRFDLFWEPTFTEPTSKTLAAVLDDVTVSGDGGLALAAVYAGMSSAIVHAFYTSDGSPPQPDHPEVPSGAVYVGDVPTLADTATGEISILDVIITAAGDLQVLVNPLPPPQSPPSSIAYGYLRQLFAQNALNSIKES